MSDIKSIHHINFLVRDLQAASRQMQAVLDSDPIVEQLPGRQVQTARFYLNGIWLVLVQPLDMASAVGRILQQRGEGLFLLSLEVDSLEDTAAALQQRGVDTCADPRQGLQDWRVQDLSVGEGLGPVLQICKPGA